MFTSRWKKTIHYQTMAPGNNLRTWETKAGFINNEPQYEIKIIWSRRSYDKQNDTIQKHADQTWVLVYSQQKTELDEALAESGHPHSGKQQHMGSNRVETLWNKIIRDHVDCQSLCHINTWHISNIAYSAGGQQVAVVSECHLPKGTKPHY